MVTPGDSTTAEESWAIPPSMVSQFFGRYRASSDMVIVAWRRGI